MSLLPKASKTKIRGPAGSEFRSGTMQDLFFYWITERDKIYTKKETLGLAPPWTSDTILREYKFTNPFRQHDRVTRYYLKHVVRHTRATESDELLYNTILFRAFNWPPTWENLGWRKTGTPWRRRADDQIACMKHNNQKVFTGAYIVTNAGEKTSKSKYVLDAMDMIWKDRYMLYRRIYNGGRGTLQNTVEVLRQYPTLGWFTSYEVACDLSYTRILSNPTDALTWANPGPGARRGLNRIMGRPVKARVTRDELILEMQSLLMTARTSGLHVNLSATVDMRTIEHSLCEFDKYSRVLLNEGRPRSRYQPEEAWQV